MGKSPKPGYSSQGCSAIHQLNPPFARKAGEGYPAGICQPPKNSSTKKPAARAEKNRSSRFQVNLHCNSSRQVRSEGVMHVNYVLNIPDANVVRDGLALLKVREAAYFL